MEDRDRRAKAFSTGKSIFVFAFFSFSLGFGALWVPLGSLLGPLEALLGGLWTQKPSKTECFLRFLKRQLFGSLKLLIALLGSSCPLFGRSGPKMGPNKTPKNAQKRKPKYDKFFFIFFFDFDLSQNGINKSQKWDPKWTRVFAQNSKEIYKRNQDEPNRAIMSFKESNNCL